MTTAIRTAMFIAVTALVVGATVGPRWVYAQTPAQMEYERQAREARQAEERRQQEQQRLQQLQNDNARRQQEETSRSMRGTTPGSQSPTQGSSPSGSTGAGAAQPASACKAKPVRGAPAAALLISVGTVTQSGAVKPLVAQGFFLLKDSMDEALTKGGFRPPPGMSPRKGMEHARINNTPDLKQAVAALLANVVCGPVLTDPNGMAQFPPLHPGTYHLVGGNLNPRLAWNLRVDLKPGANSVTLDQRNASPFDR